MTDFETKRQEIAKRLSIIKTTGREKKMMKMRWGLTKRPLAEVAKAFGVTRQRVHQIEKKILGK